MDVKLIEDMADDIHVVRAARVSTEGNKSIDAKASERLILYLMRNKHASPFEHSMFTFYVHAPIFITREILRHRWASFNEESGRYRELDPDFYYPKDENRPLQQVGKTGDYQFVTAEHLREDVLNKFEEAYGTAWSAYELMLHDGVAKEVARMVLPLGIYSSLYVTMNARSLMNFLALRTANDAQWEIRYIASQMEYFFQDIMPLTHNAWVLNGRQAI
jgi:thymidylate synthase (FAD)